MKRLALALALLLAPSAAWAGCANYTDGTISEPAPEVTLCFGGDCQTTTLSVECGNIHMAGYSFANGWSFSAANAEWSTDGKPSKTVRINDRDIPVRDWPKVSCTGADDICDAIMMMVSD